MEGEMDHSRCARLARSVFDEVTRALRVESCRRRGDAIECKTLPLDGGGIEMTFRVFIDDKHPHSNEPPAEPVGEVVRVTVRPLGIF